MNNKQIEIEFNNYVAWCRAAINSLVQTCLNQSIPGATPVKKELLSRGIITADATDIEAITIKRQELIDVKVNHTMRVVEDILRVSDKIGLSIDFKKIVEVVARLHDIGRFEYATWNDAYGEQYRDQSKRELYQNTEFSELATPLEVRNHSEAGFELLTKKGKIKTLTDNKRFLKIISHAILHHQDSSLIGELNPTNNRIDESIIGKDISQFLTAADTLNEAEIKIYAILTQLIKDVDCIDILYQHLTGEFPVLRPVTRFNKALRSKDGKDVLEMQTLEEFAKRWGFSSDEVLEFNGMTREQAESALQLNLPTMKIDPILLTMPEDLKTRFFNLEQIDLQEINKRYDYNPIIGMWWRLLQFLGTLNFTANLSVIQENELLDKIYEQFPEEYKPNVSEAFNFAKRYLLEGRGNAVYAQNPFKTK